MWDPPPPPPVMGHFNVRSLHSLKPSVTSQPIQNKLNLTSVTSQPIIYLWVRVAPRVLIYVVYLDFLFNRFVMWCEIDRLHVCLDIFYCSFMYIWRPDAPTCARAQFGGWAQAQIGGWALGADRRMSPGRSSTDEPWAQFYRWAQSYLQL